MEECDELADFVAELQFGWSAERLAEAGHAKINRRTMAARTRTEAYDRLALRFPALREDMKDPVFVEALLNQLAICRNPRKVVEALGFSEHLGCNGKVHTWSREYRRVVYHADNFSLYKKERIQIAYEDTPYDAAAELGEPHEEGDEAEPPAVVAEVFVPSSFYDQMKH